MSFQEALLGFNVFNELARQPHFTMNMTLFFGDKKEYIYDKYYHKFMALSLHHYSMILIGYAQDITNTAAYLTWYDHSQIHVRGFSSWGSVYCIMIKVHKFHVQKGYPIYFYHIWTHFYIRD